jgi:hypothetical protein
MDRRDRIRCALVALLVLALLLPGACFGTSPSRSKAVVGAARVFAGEVPYRDFWTMYAPGQFYALAAAWRVFGRELIIAAILTCALHAAAASLLYGIARQLAASVRAAAAIALAFGLSRFQVCPEFGSYPPALLLILGALGCLADRWRGGASARELQAGVLLGFAAWFKHDVAAYAAAAAILGAFAARALGDREVRPWRALARVAAGALAGAAPAAVFVALAAGADAWQDLIAFPGGDFRAVRGEAYPQLPYFASIQGWLERPTSLVEARDAGNAVRAWILCVAPELAFAAGAWLAARYHRALEPRELAAAATLLAAIPFFWLAAHVQQNTHLTSMAVASLLLAALWCASAAIPRAWKRAVLLLALFHAAGLALDAGEEVYVMKNHVARSVPFGLPGTSGVRVLPRARGEVGEIAEFVRANVPEGEPIHCGLWRHDAVVISDPRFYFLADRPSATRYHELHPGVTDREGVQREMVEEIERSGMRCAVLWRFGWPDERLDAIAARRKAALPDCGSPLLDRYFRERFETVMERGELVVVWRKDAPPPAVPDRSR